MFNRNHNIETEGKPENDDFCENENDNFETDFDGDIEDTDIDDIRTHGFHPLFCNQYRCSCFYNIL